MNMSRIDEALLRDEEYISRLTKGRNLNNPKDIEEIYGALQAEGYYFESVKGREFDDSIYELHQKVLSGKIGGSQAKPGRKPKKAVRSKNYKEPVQFGAELDLLVEAELRKREKGRKLLVVLFSLIAVLSLGYFGFYYIQSTRTSDEYETLSELKGSDALKNSAILNEKNMFSIHKQAVVLPDMLEDYKTLYVKNRELAGWLKIDGTKIDYPVMQTDNNDYYLDHNFEKEKDANGALFLDCSCRIYPRSTNMIIYGHHMKSGNMFGNLQKYAKESYYQEHKTISFDTIYEKGTYEVMYVFYSKVFDSDELVFKYYQFTDANSEKEFNYYMEEMSKLSLYDTGVSAEYGDTLLTLSTCDHSQADGRFAVVAKRID